MHSTDPMSREKTHPLKISLCRVPRSHAGGGKPPHKPPFILVRRNVNRFVYTYTPAHSVPRFRRLRTLVGPTPRTTGKPRERQEIRTDDRRFSPLSRYSRVRRSTSLRRSRVRMSPLLRRQIAKSMIIFFLPAPSSHGRKKSRQV